MFFYQKLLFFILLFFLCKAVIAQNPFIKVPGTNFSIQEHEITIDEFMQFIKVTEYKTSAQKLGYACAYTVKGKVCQPTKGIYFIHDLYGKPVPVEQWKVIPVVHISYQDAQNYATWKGEKVAIPTLQQWFLAATAGLKIPKYRYAGSNNGKSIGWYDNNSNQTVQPIKSKKANQIGAYDLCGNVCEITAPSERGKFKGKYIGVGGSCFNSEDMMDLHMYLNEQNSGWIFSKSTATYPYMGFRCIKYD